MGLFEKIGFAARRGSRSAMRGRNHLAPRRLPARRQARARDRYSQSATCWGRAASARRTPHCRRSIGGARSVPASSPTSSSRHASPTSMSPPPWHASFRPTRRRASPVRPFCRRSASAPMRRKASARSMRAERDQPAGSASASLIKRRSAPATRSTSGARTAPPCGRPSKRRSLPGLTAK